MGGNLSLGCRPLSMTSMTLGVLPLFTMLFVGYSAVIGGVVSVAYAGRACCKATTALVKGEGVIKAASDFATEFTVPLSALLVSSVELCQAAQETATESWNAASNLMNRMKPVPTAEPIATPAADEHIVDAPVAAVAAA